MLKNVLRSNLSEKYFQHLLAAFNNEDGSFYYPQLFAYLSKHGDDVLVLSFIKWTAKNLQLDHHYHRALKKYLKSHPRSIWKNKASRKKLQQIPAISFRKLIKEVQHETASPIVKFLKKVWNPPFHCGASCPLGWKRIISGDRLFWWSKGKGS